MRVCVNTSHRYIRSLSLSLSSPSFFLVSIKHGVPAAAREAARESIERHRGNTREREREREKVASMSSYRRDVRDTLPSSSNRDRAPPHPPRRRGQQRHDMDVDVPSDAVPDVIRSFEDMRLKENLLRGIYSYGFEKPSAIQQRAVRS